MTNLDPRLSLATAMVGQPGVYALLIGSGVSTGAGIPTGWGVVNSLARLAAAASLSVVDESFDPEKWWDGNGTGQPLGYSSLLTMLGRTRSARRALLAPFFEPTEDDRAQGMKVPGPAHRAIAALVRKGLVRVIVTTNFDRLLERALEAEGISPQVISSDSMIAGMEPIQHMQCTIVKLHGDYAGLDQRNTVDELSVYPVKTRRLLNRILDEYGLVVSGWSGDWDPALVAAVSESANRRYPLFWTSHSALGEVASTLTARSGAQVIQGASADDFFPDLLNRVEAIESMGDAPGSVNVLLSQIKRALPDPVRRIELRDLYERHLENLRTYLRNRSTYPPDNSGEAWAAGHADVAARSETLVRALVTGIYLDRDREHTDLWVHVIQEAMRARARPESGRNKPWDNLQHFPALLMLTGGVAAALAAGHEDVAVALLGKPRWTEFFNSESSLPAYQALKESQVLSDDTVRSFPGSRWIYPKSHLLTESIVPMLDLLARNEPDARRLVHRTEYRFALAATFFKDPNVISGQASGGEFLLNRPAYGETAAKGWELDFRENGSPDSWRSDVKLDGPAFDKGIEKLTERLEAITRSD